MSFVYEQLVRPILFRQDAEVAHERTLRLLAKVSRSRVSLASFGALFKPEPLPTSAFGLQFPNPIGLAAGMDKYASALPAWHALGFGFAELGGVTWHEQPGNPKPRIFRAVKEEAIVNRMGFNNPGAESVAHTLQKWKQAGLWPNHPVGMNFGKSKVTPLESAAEDYAHSLRVLLPYADFFVVNVSSPNTPNLRQLQDKAALNEILLAMQEVLRGSNEHSGKPLLVKVAPDLSFQALDEIVALAFERNIAGLVATNTTITRPEAPDVSSSRVYAESGGLSGRPLKARSTGVIRHLYKSSQRKLPIIGVGGILTGEDAWEKILAGACLLQIYTGLVYRGPYVVKEIVNGLRERMKNAGVKDLADAIGKAAD